MSASAPPARPLRIVVHGFNERAYAMLSLLLAGPGWSDCRLVGHGDADLGLVDLDTPLPERTWKDYRNRHPAVPALVFSLREQQRDNARHLKKPIDPVALRRAIDDFRRALDAPAPPAWRRQAAAAAVGVAAAPRGTAGTFGLPAAPARASASAMPQAMRTAPPAAAPRAARRPATSSTRRATTELDRELDERNCGSADDVDLTKPATAARAQYDPARHFQLVLERAVAMTRRTQAPHEILGLPAPLCVRGGKHPTIETSLRDTVLRSLCVLPLEPGSLRIVPARGLAAPRGVEPVAAEAMLWQVALWSARGRLRRGLGFDTPVRLARWPDFTRLVETPHAMRLAAVLVAGAYTPRELCATLRIPQRYVLSFLSAAATSPHLAVLAEASAPAAVRAQPAPARAAPPRSLLARILGRLVPSMAR